MSNPSLPPIPPRPNRNQARSPAPASTGATLGSDIPVIPPRPKRRTDRSASPYKSSESSNREENVVPQSIPNPTKTSSVEPMQEKPHSPPSVVQDILQPEGDSANPVQHTQHTVPEIRTVPSDLELQAPTPSLPEKSELEQVGDLTRIDTPQAASFGIGGADNDKHSDLETQAETTRARTEDLEDRPQQAQSMEDQVAEDVAHSIPGTSEIEQGTNQTGPIEDSTKPQTMEEQVAEDIAHSIPGTSEIEQGTNQTGPIEDSTKPQTMEEQVADDVAHSMPGTREIAHGINQTGPIEESSQQSQTMEDQVENDIAQDMPGTMEIAQGINETGPSEEQSQREEFIEGSKDTPSLPEPDNGVDDMIVQSSQPSIAETGYNAPVVDDGSNKPPAGETDYEAPADNATQEPAISQPAGLTHPADEPTDVQPQPSDGNQPKEALREVVEEAPRPSSPQSSSDGPSKQGPAETPCDTEEQAPEPPSPSSPSDGPHKAQDPLTSLDAITGPQGEHIEKHLPEERPTTGAVMFHQEKQAEGIPLSHEEGRATTGVASIIKPAIPPRPAKKFSHPKPELNPVISQNDGPAPANRSPTLGSKPPIPLASKPAIPPRPSRPIRKDSKNSSADGAPLSLVNSASSARSMFEAGGPEAVAAAKAKPKPPVPSRPIGSKIAALQGGFLSELNKKLKVGPTAPVKEEKKEEEVVEEKEKAPLVDARKGRARGPARRAPAKVEPKAKAAPAAALKPEFSFSTPTTVWEVSPEDGDLKLPSGAATPKDKEPVNLEERKVEASTTVEAPKSQDEEIDKTEQAPELKTGDGQNEPSQQGEAAPAASSWTGTTALGSVVMSAREVLEQTAASASKTIKDFTEGEEHVLSGAEDSPTASDDDDFAASPTKAESPAASPSTLEAKAAELVKPEHAAEPLGAVSTGVPSAQPPSLSEGHRPADAPTDVKAEAEAQELARPENAAEPIGVVGTEIPSAQPPALFAGHEPSPSLSPVKADAEAEEKAEELAAPENAAEPLGAASADIPSAQPPMLDASKAIAEPGVPQKADIGEAPAKDNVLDQGLVDQWKETKIETGTVLESGDLPKGKDDEKST